MKILSLTRHNKHVLQVIYRMIIQANETIMSNTNVVVKDYEALAIWQFK